MSPTAYNQLFLDITEQCNLACDYCYRKHINKTDTKTMTVNQASTAIELLKPVAHEEFADVAFLGGEPLLAKNLIKKVVHKYGKKQNIRFLISTNATLADANIAEFCAVHNVSIQVSVDGSETDHGLRKMPGGGNTYQATVKGARLLIAHKKKNPVTSRLTVSGRGSSLLSRVQHLLELGFDSVQIGWAFLSLSDKGQGLRYSDLSWLKHNIDQLAEWIYSETVRGKIHYVEPFIQFINRILCNSAVYYQCQTGAGKAAAVSVKGVLYPCHRFVGDERFQLGTVHAPEPYHLYEFAGSLNVNHISECKNCPEKTICGGPCYNDYLTNRWQMGVGDTFCGLMRCLIKASRKLVQKLEPYPVALEWLIDKGKYLQFEKELNEYL